MQNEFIWSTIKIISIMLLFNMIRFIVRFEYKNFLKTSYLFLLYWYYPS